MPLHCLHHVTITIEPIALQIRMRSYSLITFCICFALAGCGTDRIRDDAQTQLRSGNYESAIAIYEDGLVRYPDDVVLKSGLVSAKENIFARLMTSASAARASGNVDRAQDIVQRALRIYPNDDRAKALVLDIERDRRQFDTINQARDLLSKGLRERAQIVIESGLKDSPSNSELIAMQRQIELEDKQSELTAIHLAETRPISLDFKDANLRMVLDLITRNSGINFVLDKDLRQDLRSTVFLKNTPIEDALELITTTNQLAYKILNPTTILIYPRTPDKLKDYQDLVFRAFYLSNADVKQTAALLKSMLKIREPYVDEKLNMLIVRESPQTVRLAERLIALQDLAEPEVILEMEVLEIQRNRLTDIGINYPDSLTLTPLPASSTATAATGTGTTTSSGLTLANLRHLNNQNNIGVTTPSLTINLQEQVGDVNLLSNPKVRARNHEKAKIMVGDKLPVITTTGSANNNGFISESVSYVDVGLKLNVEPTIYLDDEVGIRLGLEVSSVVNTIQTATGTTAYEIGTRNVDTVLKLHDGETQLLAGLINNSEQMSANRVPGLGDLPVLGHLFSSESNNGQRSEIVLSITPHIVRNVRRPDINQTEFWSGSENDIRSKPLSLPGAPKPTNQLASPTAASGNQTPNPIPALSSAAPQGSEPDYTLELVSPPTTTIGQTFTVNVKMKSTKPLRGMPIEVMFSKDKLELVDADDGNFFKMDGAAISKTKALRQEDGRVAMTILRNVPNDLGGEGSVMTVTFKAIAEGSADIHISSATAIAAMPVIPSALPAPIKVTVK